MNTHSDTPDPKDPKSDPFASDAALNPDDDGPDADVKTDDQDATDSPDTAEVENRRVDILPPAKRPVETKRGVGMGTVITCTLFASLLGAAGGFALSYGVMPYFRPAVDVSGLESRVAKSAAENDALRTQLTQLETELDRQAAQDSGSDLSGLQSRLSVLEASLADVQSGDRAEGSQAEALAQTSKALEALRAEVSALTAFQAEDGEAVPVEIARRLSALETQMKASAKAIVKASQQTAQGPAMKADPATFMYGDTLLRDTLQEILENQIALQDQTDRFDTRLGEINTQTEALASQMEAVKMRPQAPAQTDARVTDTKPAADKPDPGQAASLFKPEFGSESPVSKAPAVKSAPEIDWSEILLASFPEARVRTALKDAELSQKNWIARFVGENMTVRKPGERDAVDAILDLIRAGDISGAITQMETLPSPVRSSAQEWMKAARQARVQMQP